MRRLDDNLKNEEPNRRVDLPRYTPIQNVTKICQQIELLERTQECEYKRQNIGGSTTKTLGV